MSIKERIIRPNTEVGSGRVKQYILSDNVKITQITTYCPDIIGPGPNNLYLIEDKILTLVDTGLPTILAKNLFYSWRNVPIPKIEKDLPDDYSETELVTGLEEAGYSIRDIELIIITHGHFDHYLMGKAIVEKNKAIVAAHLLDTDPICNKWSLLKILYEGRPRYSAMGVPGAKTSAYSSRDEIKLHIADMVLKVDYPIVSDGPISYNGTKSNLITVKHTPGHSPGSICLVVGSKQEKVLFCGDTLLYPITPLPGDLLKYLRTLNDLKQIENVAMALPAHGKNIKEYYKRIDFIKKHHRHRLEMTYNACARPKSPWEIASMPKYFDVYVDPDKFNPLAGNEAYVHIKLLEMAKGLFRAKIKGDAHLFQNTGEKFDDVYSRILDIVDDKRLTALL